MAYQNFYATKLQNQIGAADVTITVQTPPTVTAGRLVLEPRNAQKREIISFTGVSGTNLTGVTRGLYGTSAQIHSSGVLVEMNFLAQDYTDLTDAFGTFAASANDWRTAVTTVTAVTNNGQRSYDLTVNTDLRSILSPGMRLRTTRTVNAPVQTTSLNGTNQYFNDTTVSGMTFTDDFAVGAWVKLSSYPSASATIASRYNLTNGWRLIVTSSGQVYLFGYNGGGGNYSGVNTYQSLPLNKWVHVTAQLDMSAFTATSTTSYIMFDGVDVPSQVTRGGTNPTALVQGSDLHFGATNGTTDFFPGKIAQAFVSSAKITQANVRTLMSQGLTSALITSNSIISAYSGDGNMNDLNTTTANNLTAQNGAGYTADSPFGGQAGGTISATLDYGIVAKVTATTITVNVAEGCTIPTSGGITTLSYSGVKSPYGFPGQKGKWQIEAWSLIDTNMGAVTSATAYNVGSLQLSIPIGEWQAGFQVAAYETVTSSGSAVRAYFSSSSTSTSDSSFGAHGESFNTGSGGYLVKEKALSVSTQAQYYLVLMAVGTTPLSLWLLGARGGSVMRVDNAYL